MSNLAPPPGARKRREHAKRDRVLDALQQTRADLIAAADTVARRLCAQNGQVTSTEVFDELRVQGHGPKLDQVDPRFMGAVFRKGNGWNRIGFEPIGSHGRPVAVWTRGEGN